MTTAQKIIKYFAIAFAIFLIISIISVSLSVFYALTGVLGLKESIDEISNDNIEMGVTSFEESDIVNLDIEVMYTNLTIKKGETLSVETNNNNITCKQHNQTLVIEEKGNKWFFNENNSNLIIYIPEKLEFKNIEINTGAGKIDIETLIAEKLSFELGAGETKLQNLTVFNECDIDGGAGKVDILSGTINNLDLDMGVGEINLNASITGKNDIDAGVGNLDIYLQGDKESYKIRADKGIGSIKIDGREISNEEVFGNGENSLDIDGGVGNIKIDFNEEII